LYSYYEDLWIDKVYEAVQKFRKSGKTIGEISKAMPNSSSCRFILLIMVMHLKNARVTDKQKIRALCDFFVDVVRSKTTNSDLFAHDTNFAHTELEVDDFLNKTEWEAASAESAKEIGKTTVGLATLVHSLYNDWMTDYGYEICGPYDASKKFGGKHILLVRDFKDIKPVEIWPEANDFKHKSIRLLTVYKDLDCKIAYVGCHTTYSGNLLDHLSHYAVYADGKQIKGLEGLAELSSYFLGIAQELFAKYSSLDFEEQKRKYFVQEAYQLKNFFEAVGVPWKPTQDFYERVAGKPLRESPWLDYGLSFEEYLEQFGMNNIARAYEP
jgi:hypothetical protein